MRVLGIDTATSVASVALVEDGVIIAEGSYPNRAPLSAKPTASQKSHHAEVILPLIEGVIAKAQATLEALSGVAVSIGPGSFTGVRLGLATVKGLTYGWDIPVAGISTLEANAARAADFEGVICSLIDARKNEVYGLLSPRL
jgi:tRNA threonylcarbamoyladenosine biosynthesis protein TsaB